MDDKVTSENRARKHHFVPRFYLKGWSKDGETIFQKRLLVSHKNVPTWQKSSISSVASHGDLYTLVTTTKESDEIEKWLNDAVEQPASKAIQKVRNDQALTKSDFDALAVFFAVQLMRTPAKLMDSLHRYVKSSHEAISIIADILSGARPLEKNKLIESAKNLDDSNSLPINISFINDPVSSDKAYAKIDTVLGRRFWLHDIKHLADKTSSVLKAHTWHVVHAHSSIEWCTSDDPVITLSYRHSHDYDFCGGLGQENADLILPISPRHLLYTQVGAKDFPADFQHNLTFSLFIQKIIAEHAYRNIYSCKRDDGIDMFRMRIVDENKFRKESEEIKNWIKSQNKLEKEYG